MLTLLTTTGCRPQPWAICERLMARQDYAGPVRWVIVDDGAEPQPITFRRDGWFLEVISPTPHWRPGQNTQARNLIIGLAAIAPRERVVVLEDDDYYGPGYLTAVDEWLNHADLVGESHARYFNVATGVGKAMNNDRHASLCSTAMKGPAIDQLRKSAAGRRKFIDLDLWQRFGGAKQLHHTEHVVGIKGLPGRDGIGSGHRMVTGPQVNLRDWIGEDANLYG